MHPYILTPEPKEIVGSTDLSLTNITYRDINEAILTISAKVLKNYLESKTSIIVIPDAEHRNKFISTIKVLAIEDQSMTIFAHKSVTEDDLSIIRTKIRLEKPTGTSSPVDVFKYDLLSKKVNNFYDDTFRNKIFNGCSWVEMLARYQDICDHANVSLHNDIFDGLSLTFTYSEFESIKETLSEALFLYRKDFELIQTSSNQMAYFRPSTDHIDNIQNIAFTLFSLKEEASLLACRYLKLVEKMKHLFKKSTLEQMEHLEYQILILQNQVENNCFQVSKSKGFLQGLFTASGHEEVKTVSEQMLMIMDKMRQMGFSIPDVVDAKGNHQEILKSIFEEIQKRKTSLHALTENFIRAANKLNYLEPQAENLEKDLLIFLDKLNQSRLFNAVYELNTLSIKKQCDLVGHIVSELDTAALSIEKNLPYFQWISFYNKSDKNCQSIINKLKSYDPSEWMDVFCLSYYKQLLTVFFPYTDIGQDTEGILEGLLISKEKYNLDAAKQKHFDIISSLPEVIKKNFSELYQILIKGKALKNPVLWKNLWGKNIRIFAALYPITVTDSDDLADIPHSLIDEIIYLDCNNYDPDMLNVIKSSSFFYEEDRFSGAAHFRLTTEATEHNKKIHQTHTTGKISLVRNITKALLQFASEPSVFRLRNTTVISFCSEFYNEKINEYFYHSGIKRLHGDKVRDILSGALLDDQKDIFIIVEDGIINPDTYRWDFLLQKKTLDYLISIGCELINIDNKAVFETNGIMMADVFYQINTGSLAYSKNQNQMSLEFE